MWAVIKKRLIQFELSVTNLNAINLSTVKTKLADDTVKKSTLKVDWEKKPVPHWGLEPCQYCAWLFDGTLYH